MAVMMVVELLSAAPLSTANHCRKAQFPSSDSQPANATLGTFREGLFAPARIKSFRYNGRAYSK